MPYPSIRRIARPDASRSQTTGDAILATTVIAGATRTAIFSGSRNAICFGTSSPTPREPYVITATTTPERLRDARRDPEDTSHSPEIRAWHGNRRDADQVMPISGRHSRDRRPAPGRDGRRRLRSTSAAVAAPEKRCARQREALRRSATMNSGIEEYSARCDGREPWCNCRDGRIQARLHAAEMAFVQLQSRPRVISSRLLWGCDLPRFSTSIS
jgi:hypothetical protein